jgi:hypothetical protein
MQSRKQLKSRMLSIAIAEIQNDNSDGVYLTPLKIANLVIVLINKNLTLDSLTAMLALIFVYLMALVSPIKTVCLSLPKTPVFPSKNIKAIKHLSFT